MIMAGTGIGYAAGDGAGVVPGSCYYAAGVRKCGCELDRLSRVGLGPLHLDGDGCSARPKQIT